MKTLIVLNFCFAACLAHGVSNGGNGYSGGFRSNRGDSNLIDYPFTVETRTISGGTPQGNLGRSGSNYQPQQRQTIAQPNYSQNNQWSSSSIGGGISNNILTARARTQYVEIPVIVETVRSQPQQIRPQSVARNIQFQSQPQIRQQPQQQFIQQPQQQIRQQPQPQFRQQQAPIITQQQPQYQAVQVQRIQPQPQIRQQSIQPQPQIRQQSIQPQPQIRQQSIQPQPQIRQQQRSQPSFQVERSYPVASFDLPVSRGSSNNNVVGGFSNTQSSSRSLIDYPFTVEVSRSSGSSGFNSGFSRNTGGSSW